MRKTTDSFSFDIPEGWITFQDRACLVAQGPDGEELILSSWCVEAPPTASRDEIDMLVTTLLDNATKSAQHTVAEADLHVTKPLARYIDAGGWFPCWTLLARTTIDHIFFGQAVIRGRRAVMLVTLEAPCTTRSESHLQAFLDTFAPAG